MQLKKHKFYNPWFITFISVGLLSILVLCIIGSRISPGNTVANFAIVLLFLIPISCFSSGAMWIKLYYPTDEFICKSCEYDLRAHSTDIEICPECGKNPTVPSDRYSRRAAIRQLPGCLLILLSIIGFLFGFLTWFSLTHAG
jgi:predicted RNA-binding Zn-ribbon protein involved in translation (DUF1610 family)